MAYVIHNNYFTGDSFSTRSTRLSLLSEYIGIYAVELSLESAVLDWGLHADVIWQEELAKQQYSIGIKFKDYQTSQEADGILYKNYVALKALLASRYSDDQERLRIYGVEYMIPVKRSQRVNKAFELIRANEIRKAEGDPRALPDDMIDKIKLLADDAVEKYNQARKSLDESKLFTKDFRKLYKEDSSKFGALYRWVIAKWGDKTPRLINLGFVQAKPRGGRRIQAPENLSYNSDNNLFSWDKLDGATSYQLVYAKPKSKDWTEVYQGKENEAVFEVPAGKYEFMVRARNKHGFGKWSEKIEVG